MYQAVCRKAGLFLGVLFLSLAIFCGFGISATGLVYSAGAHSGHDKEDGKDEGKYKEEDDEGKSEKAESKEEKAKNGEHEKGKHGHERKDVD